MTMIYRIPVVEFLQSVSDGVVLFQPEEKRSTRTVGAGTSAVQIANGDSSSNNGDIHGDMGDVRIQQRRQVMENAVRIALAITRRFIKFHHLFGTVSFDYVPDYLPYIQLDDFFVKCEDDCTCLADHQQQQSVFFSWFDGKDAAYRDCSIETKTMSGGNNNNNSVSDENGKISGGPMTSKRPRQADEDVEKLSSLDLAQLKKRPNESNIKGSSSREANEPNKFKSSSAFSGDSGGLHRLTLLGVEIVFATGTQHKEHHSKRTQIQILGHLLYSVFSRGKSPPSDIFKSETSTSQSQEQETAALLFAEEDISDSNEGSSNKTLRTMKVSAFSQLVESDNALPISICRFLSDMIDVGTKGEDDSMFTSYDHVIQDLEQMVSQPQIFLHGSSSPPVGLRPSMFGQTCHGRKEEVATLMKLANQIMEKEPSHDLKGVQAAFVSGIAGSGKSYLVQAVQENLTSLGWIAVKAKFERRTKHTSRGILSSMFDQIVKYLVEMKESKSPADVAYSQRASTSISNSIGYGKLSGLVDFLPSLPLLFDNGIGREQVKRSNHDVQVQAKGADRQLKTALTQILKAVLESGSGRFIMICCDDLQWADETTLSLISELLVNVGDEKHLSHHCIFVGLYRSDEIDSNHPFSMQHSYLRLMSSSVNLTEIELSSLSKEDVVSMLMAVLQLPQRLVTELADLVYKKTAGHALFVAELLNSLIRDSIVTYSPVKCRYAWDVDRIHFIRTGDSVAELIALNLKSLAPESQQVLQILSCFGVQTEDSLLHILERFQEGIICSIDTFIDQGVLDRAGPIVTFTHDLIQQAVYESMPLDEQKSLHLRIGQFLGIWASSNASLTIEQGTEGSGQLHLKDQVFYAGRNLASTLLSIACEQINTAGSDSTSNNSLKVEFAKWNHSAGQSFECQSDFSAAQYYYLHGITFLGLECWSKDAQLSLKLHHGAVLSSFALGEADNVDRYAQPVIKHVPFEDTIGVQQIVLKTLTHSDRHLECVSRGIGILRQMNFHIPLAPSNEDIVNAMASTTSIASQYSSDRIISLCHGTTDDSTYAAVKIMDTLYVSTFAIESPFLPMIACELIKFSLQNGICPESAMSFATFAFNKIFLEGDYSGGKYWSDVARNIIKSHPNKNKGSEIHAEFFMHIAIDIYFMTPRNIAIKLINLHHSALKIGEGLGANICFSAWRFRLFGGHNLSLVLQSLENLAKLTAKHSKFGTKFLALDSILLMELTGKKKDCFSLFGDSFCSVDDEAKSSMNTFWLHNFHLIKMLTAYWSGDYMAAEEHSNTAFTYPAAKKPWFVNIYHAFFAGLIALHLHRQVDGKGERRLKQGREMMEKFQKWAENSSAAYENKWLLLKAEYCASIGEHDKARLMYQASTKAAKDHGNIHELALAFELLGNHYCSTNGSRADSKYCFGKACVYYKQWGADAVAEKLIRKHDLMIDPEASPELRVERKSKSPRV